MKMQTPHFSFTDFQPYLLPGTDPWALSEAKAISLLNYLKARGIDQIYCIPPVHFENAARATASLQRAFRLFQQCFSTDCTLKLAARYRLDDGFSTLLKSDDLLRIGIHLITDVSPLQSHSSTFDMLGEIRNAGYIPVVVQPERTTYWREEDFIRLQKSGVQLMLNLYSLFGFHGDNALMYSRWMLSKGMYTYVCSGIEDTKLMRYIENFTMNADDVSIKELCKLEDNGRIIWDAT